MPQRTPAPETKSGADEPAYNRPNWHRPLPPPREQTVDAADVIIILKSKSCPADRIRKQDKQTMHKLPALIKVVVNTHMSTNC